MILQQLVLRDGLWTCPGCGAQLTSLDLHGTSEECGLEHASDCKETGTAQVLTRLAELENAVSWQTSCTSCAATLDASYQATVRAESAEEKLAQIREAVAGDGPGAAAVREKVTRILDGASS
jgi:hypothetical protein